MVTPAAEIARMECGSVLMVNSWGLPAKLAVMASGNLRVKPT
jgi:hypothetical protein